MSASSDVRHILDIPDEILVEILLHLDVRERIALGNLSKRFYQLVFKDKKLLKDLDFSKEGRLISASDIQQYFNNDETNKHILKVNLRNVNCIEPGQMLNDSIGKALNLVDLNIHGIEFETTLQLKSFLTPLIHLKRLSVNWPNQNRFYDDSLEDPDPDSYTNLHEILSRLTYLSVITASFECICHFSACAESCQKLKHLRIIQEKDDDNWNDMGGYTPDLNSLEILEIYGIENCLMEFLYFGRDHERWTHFRVPEPLDQNCCYVEKNVEVCEEIVENGGMDEIPRIDEYVAGFTLDPECLLKAVIKITHAKPPEKFCSSEFDGGERCALKIEDAKQLLKNPRHQIKYLYLRQSIGTESDVHLLTLASPSLIELYLSDMIKIKRSTLKQTDSQKQSLLTNESVADSSFEMLVKRTPLVQDLTLNGRAGELEVDEDWDLGALFLIRGWQNLKSLRLLSIPIRDGEFLVEIGKQCKNLEKLEFYNLGPVDACCYTKDLSLMLRHCQNLTDFSLHASNIGLVSEVFFSLAKNLQLKRVRLRSSGEINDTANLVSSVEQLLRRCSRLTTFVCVIDGISQAFSDQLTSLLSRLKTELNRPTLQFQVVCSSSSVMDTVCEDASLPFFPYTWDQFSYV